MFLTSVIVTIFIIIISISFGYYQWKKKKSIQSILDRNIPYAEHSSFFNVLLFKKRMEFETDDYIKRFGKIYGFYLLGGININIADLELIQIILNKEFQNFPNRRKINTNDDFFSNALSIAELEQWKRLRAIVTQTFVTGKLKRMKYRLDSICKTLIKNINNEINKSNDSNNCILNVKQYAGAFTMDTVLQVAFGCQIDSLHEPDNIIIKNAKQIFGTDLSLKNILIFVALFIFPQFLINLLKLRPNNDIVEYFYKFSLEIIDRKRKEFAGKDFSKASTFIEFLLEAEYEWINSQKKIDNNNNNNDNDQEGDKKSIKYMTNTEMIAQCILFFLVGYDTTASTIQMALYYLSLNPDKQQLAFNEIDKILKKLSNDNNNNDNPLELIQFESYNTKFEYINAIVNETLRLSPAAPFIERRCANDFVLKTNDNNELLIKKDEIIRIPVWSLHYNDEYFPESEKFKPERFCKETSDNHPNYAYLPFGSGPRACVAKSLALLEAKMSLIWLIKNFKFSTCNQTKIPIEYYNQGGILIPKTVYLKVEKR